MVVAPGAGNFIVIGEDEILLFLIGASVGDFDGCCSDIGTGCFNDVGAKGFDGFSVAGACEEEEGREEKKIRKKENFEWRVVFCCFSTLRVETSYFDMALMGNSHSSLCNLWNYYGRCSKSCHFEWLAEQVND